MRLENLTDEFRVSDDDNSSIDEQMDNTSITARMEHFIREMLKSKVFIGTYKEKELCEPIMVYKDVIMVNKDETEFLKVLHVAKRRMEEFCSDEKIRTCITEIMIDGGKQYQLWTEIKNVPIGKHWFMVKSIDFHNNQIILNIKYLRSYQSKVTYSGYKRGISEKWSSQFYKEYISWDRLNFNFATLSASLNNICRNINLTNMLNTARFIFIFLIVTVGALFEFIKLLMDFSLKLLDQLKGLIRSITPIALALIEMNTKIVYGVFVLVSICFRGNKNVAGSFYNKNDYTTRKITPNRYMPSNNYYYGNNRSK